MNEPAQWIGGPVDRTILRLRAALEAAKIPHHVCVQDGWYSCPKSGECLDDMMDPNKCYCGADAHNAKIDEALSHE